MDQPQLRILIGMGLDASGKLVLLNSVGDPVQAYGLLEMAKDAVRKAADEAAKGPKIVAPPPGVNGQKLRITE